MMVAIMFIFSLMLPVAYMYKASSTMEIFTEFS